MGGVKSGGMVVNKVLPWREKSSKLKRWNALCGTISIAFNKNLLLKLCNFAVECFVPVEGILLLLLLFLRLGRRVGVWWCWGIKSLINESTFFFVENQTGPPEKLYSAPSKPPSTDIHKHIQSQH